MIDKKIKRINYEKKTVLAMIEIYCRAKHNKNKLCDECNEMLKYAYKKIELCPFLPDKPVCKNCPVHCYEKDRRERIRLIMRYAGPKIFIYKPVLALIYILNNIKDLINTKNRVKKNEKDF